MYFTTRDGTELFYEDTGGAGRPVVFIHGWPLSSSMWEYQFNELPERGMRCIAYDRRGFGCSDHASTGYDYDTLASDLSDLLEHLDLQDVTLVGFSMGGGEVARYMRNHGGKRVIKAALVAAVTPCMLKTQDNPDGVDPSVFADMEQALRKDRPAFLKDFTKKFFGVGLLSSPVSDEVLAASCAVAMQASSRATLACAASFATTDFRPDMKAFIVPTLLIHGDADKTVPIDVSAKRAVKFIPGAILEVYEGAPHGLHYTHRDRLNADLERFVMAGAATRAHAA